MLVQEGTVVDAVAVARGRFYLRRLRLRQLRGGLLSQQFVNLVTVVLTVIVQEGLIHQP